MSTIADIAEFLIFVGLFILAIIAVDRFWTLAEFLGEMWASGLEWMERRRSKLNLDKPRNRVVLISPLTTSQLQQIAGRVKRPN